MVFTNIQIIFKLRHIILNLTLEKLKTVIASLINPQPEICLLIKEIGWAVNRKMNCGDFGKINCSKFGNKSSFTYTRGSVIIVGAMAMEGNAYDGHTLKPQLGQIKELTGR